MQLLRRQFDKHIELRAFCPQLSIVFCLVKAQWKERALNSPFVNIELGFNRPTSERSGAFCTALCNL